MAETGSNHLILGMAGASGSHAWRRRLEKFRWTVYMENGCGATAAGNVMMIIFAVTHPKTVCMHDLPDALVDRAPALPGCSTAHTGEDLS